MIAPSPRCAEPAAPKLSNMTLHSHDQTRTINPRKVDLTVPLQRS
jgi:hypothetical protein